MNITLSWTGFIRVCKAKIGLTQCLVPGTNGDSQLGRGLAQIQEANLSDADRLDKLGLQEVIY